MKILLNLLIAVRKCTEHLYGIETLHYSGLRATEDFRALNFREEKEQPRNGK